MIDLFLLLWCKIVICRKQNAKCKFIKGCQKKVLRIPCHCFIGCFGNTISFLYCLFQNVFMCNFSSIPGHSVSGTYQKRTQEEGLRQFFRRLLCCYPANYQLQSKYKTKVCSLENTIQDNRRKRMPSIKVERLCTITLHTRILHPCAG